LSSSQAAATGAKGKFFAHTQIRAARDKFTPKMTTVVAYAGVFLLVISMVAMGYQPPQKIETVANASQVPTADIPAQPSVDNLVATNVAAGIAERAELPIASNVANLSVSLSAQSQLAQSENNIVSKPQIVQPTAGSREVSQYTAQPGDTAPSVAQKFNLSPNTIKWANNLSSDAIEAGRVLNIPPVDGVVYTSKAGDTVESLASKYQSNANAIVTFNDLEIAGLTPGRQLIIPGGVLPETERPGYVAPSRAASSGSYNGGYSTVNAQIASASAGNRYAFGNCTWYAYERRAQLGRPVGSFWGNAATWAMYARAAGYLVNNTPAVGAVMQNGGGYGHVAIVESVNSDGSITISEMNYAGNFNRVTSRTVDAGSVGAFSYIH
jgi:surface antigen